MRSDGVSMIDSTSGADYTPLAIQAVTFPTGSTSGTTLAVSLTPLNDLAAEGNETVNLTLQNPSGPAALGTTAGTLTIDDEDTASFSIQATDTAAEQGGVQTTDVTLILGGSGAGTATSGTDYNPSPRTPLSSAPSLQTVTVFDGQQEILVKVFDVASHRASSRDCRQSPGRRPAGHAGAPPRTTPERCRAGRWPA